MSEQSNGDHEAGYEIRRAGTPRRRAGPPWFDGIERSPAQPDGTTLI